MKVFIHACITYVIFNSDFMQYRGREIVLGVIRWELFTGEFFGENCPD